MEQQSGMTYTRWVERFAPARRSRSRIRAECWWRPISTTFTVEPLGPARTRVTIATEAPTKPGVSGVIERVLAKSFLQRVYITELERLEEQVKNINRFRE